MENYVRLYGVYGNFSLLRGFYPARSAIPSPEGKVPDHTFAITEEMLKEGVKIRKGKKVFHKAILA